jgi:glycosyltransferase involved in cell wall biosynthesis
MNLVEEVNQKMIDLKICVIIPTYNNHKTLQRVIDGVLHYTNQIIVVNDGSTDTTKSILEKYNSLEVLHLPKNKGKGNALSLGFKKAKELHYHHAITIDSDGQHFPDDISTFITALETESNPVLLIGNRNMNQDGIPKKSSFGNAFSNFWFWFETGIKLDDTQSGYRLYPLQYIPKKFFTNKFEFEIEVIVRTAWKGVAVKNIPIKILYDPNERVSHFRPFKDFTRISILNTVLVIITILYIKPRDFFRSFKKKSFKDFIREDVLESSDSNAIKASSIALGTFIGIAPLWGFQTFIVITLAVLFRWNKVLAFAFSNISIPPMIPFIIYASLKVGGLFVSSDTLLFSENKLTFEAVKNNLTQYLIGSFVLAIFVALFFGLISYFLLSYKKKSVI